MAEHVRKLVSEPADLGAVGVELWLGRAVVGEDPADENESSQMEQLAVDATVEQLPVGDRCRGMVGHQAASAATGCRSGSSPTAWACARPTGSVSAITAPRRASPVSATKPNWNPWVSAAPPSA